MKTRVSEQGLLIPKQWLDGVDEVEIVRENGRIVVIPLNGRDPILDLGKNPITDSVDDASENHDRYLYNP